MRGETKCERVSPEVSTNRHAFKHSEAARLMRAAKLAGFKVKGVTLKDGKPYLEVDDTPTADGADSSKPNPLDRVLDHAQD
jgi:hypothetical protein